MGESFITFTPNESSVSRITPPILKISTPKGTYKSKDINDLYENIKVQVGNHYLPVVVPEDVRLEVIDII